jgi:hypothetical protein
MAFYEVLIGRFHMSGLFCAEQLPAGPDGNPRTRSLIKLAHSRRIESHGVFSFLVDHLTSRSAVTNSCVRL